MRDFHVLMDQTPGEGGGAPAPAPAGDPPADAPGSGDPAAPVAKGPWPDNWRQVYAGEDAKKLKPLERFASPQAAFDALLAAQQRIRSGELLSVLPKDATPAQIKEWRTERGIPEKPDGYDVKVEGAQWDDKQEAALARLQQTAHGLNMEPGQVKAVAQWLKAETDTRAELQAGEDENDRKAGEDSLRVEWGPEYRRNVNLVNNLLDLAPKGLKERIQGARLSDGKGLGNDPDVLRWLTSVALQLNPQPTLTGGGTANLNSIEDEIKGLEKRMASDRKGYFQDEKAQGRYRELLEVRQRLKA